MPAAPFWARGVRHGDKRLAEFLLFAASRMRGRGETVGWLLTKTIYRPDRVKWARKPTDRTYMACLWLGDEMVDPRVIMLNAENELRRRVTELETEAAQHYEEYLEREKQMLNLRIENAQMAEKIRELEHAIIALTLSLSKHN